eukprot:TRINITY_DN3422_c0_g1_i5.p1 TRINITY_DN3422_c0_g1~~TRINITY_DN3422_c0_g1_i5.p1  ORF type:complete len:186 (-),score=71.23 TRINITY_DN3422_c0_g1_i5:251-808(-)
MEAEKIAIDSLSEEENGKSVQKSEDENGQAATTNGLVFEGVQSSMSSEGYEAAKGQEVEFKFLAGVNGKFDLTVLLTCDSWIGCEKVLTIKNFKVEMLSRAEAEGRVQRGKPKEQAEVQKDENQTAGEIEEEDEEDDDEEDDYSYDSDETGTEVTASEDEEDDKHKEDGQDEVETNSKNDNKKDK